MTILDARSSGSARRQGDGTQTSSAPADAAPGLDPIDRLILCLERVGPGPHHAAVGISRAEYLDRLRRLLYDQAANELAGDAMSRLRVELCSADPTWAAE